MENNEYWLKLDKLINTCNLKIDRAKGTTHPRYPSFVYPFDYGYLENTQSGDGSGIDVWLGTLSETKVTGVVCCVDLDKRDLEVKILLNCTSQEAQVIFQIHNRGDQSAVLLLRPESY